MLVQSEILLFVDFTHVPPSRYLFQGADLEKCTTSDTLDSSSGSSENASLNHNLECEGSSPCINNGRQPDVEGCDGTAVEKLSSKEKPNDVKSSTSCQASLTTEARNTDKTSYNHNETALCGTYEPLNKKPKLDQES